MTTKIVMPQLGESVVDGTVAEWLKQVGDHIEEYESLVRVSTDKVDTEIPSPASGTLLEIYVDEGETVDAGVLLGLIGEANEQLEGNGTHAQQPTASTTKTTYSNDNGKRGRMGHVTPVVARMAQEHQLDLSAITGTGRNGRIRKKDVLAYLEQQDAVQAETDLAPWEIPVEGGLFKPSVEYGSEPPVTQSVAATPTKVGRKASEATPQAASTSSEIPGEVVAISGIRRSIAQHMVESKLQTAPHVTTVMEADMSAIVAHRATNKEQFAQRGVRLTFTPYFVAACAQALLDVPELNVQWTDKGLYQYHVANVGIATALDEGLIVPVIKNAQDFKLIGLARQVNDLAERARARQLASDEVRGGTFTISNHGTSGSLLATPIINQPQSAILGVGAIEKRVKVVDDAIAIRPCCYLSLTFDHRVADGERADAFLMRVKSLLENWR